MSVEIKTNRSRFTRLSPGRKRSNCKHCNASFIHPKSNPGIFCCIECKAEWQRSQKPVDRDWLYQKYVTEGLDCTAIARIVNRNSKRVWEWLRNYGIETRARGSYFALYPAFSFWLHGNHSPMLGKKMSPESRAKISAIAKAQGRLPFDPKIGPPYRGKRGAETPNWKGGVTAERQAFYGSPEWKSVVKMVWKRDNAQCQCCGQSNSGKKKIPFDIHHIISFECKELRAELSNLVLLCERCHYWIHSKKNVDRLFTKEIPNGTS